MLVLVLPLFIHLCRGVRGSTVSISWSSFMFALCVFFMNVLLSSSHRLMEFCHAGSRQSSSKGVVSFSQQSSRLLPALSI